MGDLTQIVTANLAAHYHSPLSVALGALLALWSVAGIAVVSGQTLLRFVNIDGSANHRGSARRAAIYSTYLAVR